MKKRVTYRLMYGVDIQDFKMDDLLFALCAY